MVVTVYGYARTNSAQIDDQAAELSASGCSTVFSDFRISTEGGDGWRRLVEAVQPGDTVRVVEWSRLTRDATTAGFIRDTLGALGVSVEVLGR